MAITVHLGAGNVTTAKVSLADTDVVASVPSNTLDGDLLIACHATDDDLEVLAAPGGWTPVHDVTGSGTNTYRSFYRIADSEPPNYTFTSATNESYLTSNRNHISEAFTNKCYFDLKSCCCVYISTPQLH